MDNVSAQTVIAADTEITGTIKSAGTVRIDGKMDGELHCEKDALVGKSATVKGNLSVSSAVVEGTVSGNIVARDRIELKSSARLTGDIKAKRLVVEDGVTFVGRSEVNASGTPVAAPAAPPVAPSPAASAAEPPRPGMFAKR
jgi:cytoskeletal protein CcmA (bactofilin family)